MSKNAIATATTMTVQPACLRRNRSDDDKEIMTYVIIDWREKLKNLASTRYQILRSR
jgi:hypothetical protein